MKLSEQERLEAEKKLKHLSTEVNVAETIKGKIKEQSKKIQTLLNQVKQSEQSVASKVELLAKFTEQVLEDTLKLQSLEGQFASLEQKVKSQKEKAVNQRFRTVTEKEKYSEAIEDIKNTIAKIQKTVKDAQTDEDQKRISIEKDLEKSLGEIREKIKTQDEEANTTNKETVGLKAQVAELRAKLEGLQAQYESKANEKQDQVKKEKDELLDKLKVLEQQASEISRLTTEFGVVEKKNFDNKLTLYIKQTKFPDFAGSFQNTAGVISQCKDELFKGVQRLNDLQVKRDNLQANAEKYDKQFLAILGTNNAIKQQIQKIKKAKETVRTNILTLQSQIKAKKQPKA